MKRIPFCPRYPDPAPLNRDRQQVVALIDEQIGREMRQRGRAPWLMHWRGDAPDTNESRLSTWRARFEMATDAERQIELAVRGARVKRGWWLRFRNAPVAAVRSLKTEKAA